MIFGLPHIGPYNVNSIMNPLLVMCMSLGYFFNFYIGKPLVRPGGVVIVSHPTPWAFHPVHHPSYIDFFEEVLSATTDPLQIEKVYEERFATDEWYRHLYRTSYAYHGVHPFYMWYWGAHALEHAGSTIIVGGNRKAVRRMGFKPATTLADALEMAEDQVGPGPDDHIFPLPPGDAGKCPLRPSPLRPMSAKAGDRSDKWPEWAKKAPDWRAPLRRPLPFPLGAPTWPTAVPRPRKRSASASTTTPNGHGATRSAWPGRRGPSSSPGPSWPPLPSRRWKGSTASTTVARRSFLPSNHSSHLDTPLVLSVLPDKWRHKIVTLAAADYFFDTRLKAVYFAFSLNAVPIERTRVSRDSSDRAEELLAEGWNLLIFPEGGRSPDGWGQEHHRGAAWLAARSGRPLVPLHIEGTGRLLAPGRQAHIHGQDQGDLRGARYTRTCPPASSWAVSKVPSPLSPTRPPRTGGRLACGRRRGPRPPSPVPTPHPGAARGRSGHPPRTVPAGGRRQARNGGRPSPDPRRADRRRP